MDNSLKNDLNQPNQDYLSLNQTLALLDCSKFYLYKLVKKGILKQYRLEQDSSGRPVGKPYFSRKQINDSFRSGSK